MAGSKADYLEDELLDHVLGGGDYARPATVYIALFTVDPSDAGGGTEVSTDDWTNYARVAVTNNATNWPAALGGAKSNGAIIDFGTATIVGAGVTVTAFAILDASSNFLYWAELTADKTITNGDPVQFPIGAIDITEG
jgi:hypothetical protein